MTRTLWQIAGAIALILGIAAGAYFIGERSGRNVAPEVITAAPGARQADNSIIVERKPQKKTTPAPHVIPKGAVEERRVHVEVQPHAENVAPVRVDLSLVRQDGGRRVIASSPDGDVVGALDIPIEEGVVPVEPKRWAAGVSYNLNDKSQGVWIERDLARVRLGADLIHSPAGGVTASVRVGITW